jgi:hypothetical protein
LRFEVADLLILVDVCCFDDLLIFADLLISLIFADVPAFAGLLTFADFC